MPDIYYFLAEAKVIPTWFSPKTGICYRQVRVLNEEASLSSQFAPSIHTFTRFSIKE